MPRDYRVYLEDIVEAADRVLDYVSDMSCENLRDDAKTLDAVVRNLEIIGEAAKKVPESVRVAHPDVEWKRIAGLRDILIHQYFEVDVEIIWDVVCNKLPQLKINVSAILGN